MMRWTYDDDQPWIALYNSEVPGEKELKQEIDNFGLGFVLGCRYHVEPLARYNADLPRNPVWQPLGMGHGMMEALELTWTDMETRYARYFRINKQKLETKQVDRKTRFRIMHRDDFKCRLCGRGAADGVTLEVDHIYPKAHGGSNHIDNLWTLCFDCNRAKRDTILEVP